MLRGFDVSFLTDWAALQREHGISFGVTRCMRSTEGKDAAFDANWQRMGDLAGFVRMAYAFASPELGSDAIDDARLFWDYVTAAGPLTPTDYFWLDLERSVLTQEETNDWAERWYDEFAQLNPYWPGIYNGGYLMNRTGIGLNQRFGTLWYPRPETRYDTAWPKTFTPKLPLGATSWADTNWGRPPNFWQTAFHWKIPGYPDHDADVFDGTLAQLQALNQEPPVAHDPLDTADVHKILYTDNEIKAPPSDPNVATNPYWAWWAHVQRTTEAALYGIPKRLDGLATKDDTKAIQDVLTGYGLQLNAMEDILRTVAADVKALRVLLPGE